MPPDTAQISGTGRKGGGGRPPYRVTAALLLLPSVPLGADASRLAVAQGCVVGPFITGFMALGLGCSRRALGVCASPFTGGARAQSRFSHPSS